MRASTGKRSICALTAGKRDSREFARVQERLRGYQRAPTMAEIARSGQRYPAGEQYRQLSEQSAERARCVSVVALPDVSIFNGGVQVSVPSNWRQVNEGNSVWFVPEGAYGQYNGQAVYTHGASFGVAQTNNRNLQRATQELINGLAQGNNNLRTSGGYQRTTLSGRNALCPTLSNVNEATGRPETVQADHDATAQRAIVLHDCRRAAERTQVRKCVQSRSCARCESTTNRKA